MKIKFVEVSNFRKLKSTHIDFDEKTTIFVGANNSGKTSAMVALRYFLLSPARLALRDITIANWPKIDALGEAWEGDTEADVELDALLPAHPGPLVLRADPLHSPTPTADRTELSHDVLNPAHVPL